jgi:SAM-dependent methyltransferase
MTARRPSTFRGSRVTAYGELAEAYDLVHSRKPYAQEARVVRSLARRYARRPLRTLLDVACGSGRHLEQFARWFDCTGLDRSPAMLARARRRVPGAKLVQGRMESFDLGRTFDVVTCLFSAIGYVPSEAGLRRTLRGFARHTAPGGVVVIEPWLTPEVFRAGLVHHLVVEGEGLTVARMNATARRSGRSIFDFHFLVGRSGRVLHSVERHSLGLFSRTTMRDALRSAGLTVRYVRGGFPSHRGLWLGRVDPAGEQRDARPVRAGRSPRRGRP